MIILDFDLDGRNAWQRSNSFFGKPFIWCLLHNLGGARALYGNFPQYVQDPVAAEQDPDCSIAGTGIIMGTFHFTQSNRGN